MPLQKLASAVALPTQYFCTAAVQSVESYVLAAQVHTFDGPCSDSVLCKAMLLLLLGPLVTALFPLVVPLLLPGAAAVLLSRLHARHSAR